jgi:hypothetical protein
MKMIYLVSDVYIKIGNNLNVGLGERGMEVGWDRRGWAELLKLS